MQPTQSEQIRRRRKDKQGRKTKPGRQSRASHQLDQRAAPKAVTRPTLPRGTTSVMIEKIDSEKP